MNNLRSAFTRVSNSALNLLLPLACLGCGRDGKLLCPECLQGLTALRPPFCSLCADPLSGPSYPKCARCSAEPLVVEGIRCPYIMEGLLQQAIYAFKYRNLRALAPELAGLLSAYMDSHPFPGDCLVPVPLHSKRLRHRGYNQAGLLAKELGKLQGLPVAEHLLRRVRDASPQVNATSRQQRKENVAGGFTASGIVPEAKIILIDDVATTGSTLSACAQALKEAGASSVWALTLAREI